MLSGAGRPARFALPRYMLRGAGHRHPAERPKVQCRLRSQAPLLAFLEHPHQVLSRDHLLDLTKNRCAGPFDRSIDIQVSRLRHKIEEDQKQPKIIKTVRSCGYVLTSTVDRF